MRANHAHCGPIQRLAIAMHAFHRIFKRQVMGRNAELGRRRCLMRTFLTSAMLGLLATVLPGCSERRSKEDSAPAELLVASDSEYPTNRQPEVSAAIAQLETNLVAVASVDAANVVLNFAERSKDVRIRITPETVPWLREEWGLKPDEEQGIRSLLLAAYVAGNVKSQLAAGKAADDPYSGWLFVMFQSKLSFSSPSIDSLERRRAQGTLKQHAQEVLRGGAQE